MTGTKQPENNARHEMSNIVYIGMILVLVLEYLRPNNYLPVLNAIKINTAIPIAVFITALFSRKGPSLGVIFRQRNTICLLIMLVMLCISVITAEVRLYSFRVFIAVFGYCLIYYSIRKIVTNTRRMHGIFLSFVVIHILLICLNPDVFLHPETRNYLVNAGFLGDGNDFALSICIVIPMAYYLMGHGQTNYVRLLSIIAIIFLCMCVISTQSRGGTLTLCIILTYFLLKSKKKLLGMLAIGLLIVLGLMYAPAQYYERMDRIADYEQDGSAQGRLLAWQSAIRMAMDRPLLGVGSGNFPTSYGTSYRPPGVGRTEIPWATAHSIYFLALGELGFPGLILILTIVMSNVLAVEKRVSALRGSGKTETEDTERLLISLNGSMLAYAIGGAFLSVLYYPHMYILVGLLGSGLQLSAQNEKT